MHSCSGLLSAASRGVGADLIEQLLVAAHHAEVFARELLLKRPIGVELGPIPAQRIDFSRERIVGSLESDLLPALGPQIPRAPLAAFDGEVDGHQNGADQQDPANQASAECAVRSARSEEHTSELQSRFGISYA